MGKFERLDLFLEDALDRVWSWGEWDCALCPAAWVRALGHPDPAADLFRYGGGYDTALGAARVVRKAGGMVALWTDVAARAGARPVSTPRKGDVGLIRLPDAEQPGPALLVETTPPSLRETVGAVCIGGGHWATASAEGIGILNRPAVVRAWRVEVAHG